MDETDTMIRALIKHLSYQASMPTQLVDVQLNLTAIQALTRVLDGREAANARAIDAKRAAEAERRLAAASGLIDLLVHRYPDLHTRAERALDIYLANRVTKAPQPDHYTVQNGARTYTVVAPDDPNRWYCMLSRNGTDHSHEACPDARAPRTQHGPRCKHQIAVWLRLNMHAKGFNHVF